jgi:hypothetical protein
VDLQAGPVFFWRVRLPDGGGWARAATESLPLLWPRFLEDSDAPPWRVAFLDDSNNEPSVTISCGGDSGRKGWPWLVDRTLTLGATSIREDVTVTNLLTAEASFEVVEEPRITSAHERIVEELKLLEASGGAGSSRVFQPKRLSGTLLSGDVGTEGATGAPPSPFRVTLPGTGWSASQRWGAPSTAELAASGTAATATAPT